MNKRSFFLLCIIIVASVIRFWKLDVLPNGLQQDETSLGYNAYSILKTGKDEHGVSFPQNFKAFGEYKLPGYIYLSVIPIFIFGLNSFSIRFISALSGVISVILIYFITKELFKKHNDTSNLGFEKFLPLAGTILLAINPWNIHFSRGAFESNVAAMFIAAGLLFFLKGLSKENFKYLVLSIFSFAAAIYTYNIARLFVPLFVLILTIIYRKEIQKSFTGKHIIYLGLITITLLFPFIKGFIGTGGFKSTKGTLLFSSAVVQSQLLEIRSYFTSFPAIIISVFFNRFILSLWYYIINLFNYLNVDFFFIHGPQHGNHGVGLVGLWYLFELPTVILGLFHIINSKNVNKWTILSWILLTIATASLTREAPQATRSYFLNIPVTILSAIGTLIAIRYIYSLQKKYLQKAGLILSAAFCLYCIIFYYYIYTVRFPVYYAKSWRTADRDVSLFLKIHQDEYNSIIIDSDSGFQYTSLLFYLSYPPSDFHGAEWTPDDNEGFSSPIRFGKYEFKKIDWINDLKRPNILILTSGNQNIEEGRMISEVKYPQRPVVIPIKEQIVQFPVEEAAYKLIITK